MKHTDIIDQTLMDENQKGHIETIARRNGIQFLDRTLAMAIAVKGGKEELLYSAASFAMLGQNEDGQERKALFLDHDDARTALEAYFIALHELAHIILRHHTNNQDDITNEIEAWEWTLSHTQCEPDDDILVLMQDCLATYCDGREAELRPDSLLALTIPDNWQKYGWGLNQFIKDVKNLTAESIVVGNRIVPAQYARMVAGWVVESRRMEKETLMDNVLEALQELSQKLET